MTIKSRSNGIPLRGGSGGGGSITVNDHTGQPISTGVRTIEWQTLDQFGFTVVQDVSDPTKVIVGAAPVFLPEISWTALKTTKVRVAESDSAQPDAFITNGFEGQVVDGTLDTFVYQSTLGRGFGPESRLSVKTYHGATLVDDVTFTCAANGSQTLGNVTCLVSGYAEDGDGSAFAGQLRVTVDPDGVIGSTRSGMCRVEVSFLEQKWDERRNINQDIFRDKNPETPDIRGGKYIQETRQLPKRFLKYLSGIAYFDLGTEYEISVGGIYNHNEDSSKPTDSLIIDSSNFGITDYTATPFLQPTNFAAYTNLDSLLTFNYYEERPIDMVNFRHIGNSKFSARVADSWNTSVSVDSNILKMCIDTVNNPSTDTVEYFDSENKRLDNDMISPWDSKQYCTDGEAVVFNGSLYHGADLPRIIENVAGALGSLGSLTTSIPNEDEAGNARQNPNYTGFTRDAVFIRKFIAPSATVSYPTMNLNILTNGTLATLLNSGDLEVYIWKLDSIDTTTPNTTLPAPHNPTQPRGTLQGSIWGHANYNFAEFDDGAAQTADTSGCKLSVTGNILSVTFGGFNVKQGVLVKFIQKRGVVIREVTATFA